MESLLDHFVRLLHLRRRLGSGDSTGPVLAAKGGGKPVSDPSQLLVYLVETNEFNPVDPTFTNFPEYPGTRNTNILDELELNRKLPALGVIWENVSSVEITPTPPPDSDPVTLSYSPFLVALKVDELFLGVSIRITDFEGGIKYKNDQSTAQFDPRLEDDGGDVEPLYDAAGLLNGFIVHVHADGVLVHGAKRKNHDKLAGNISIGDLVFKLDSDGDGVPD